MLKDYLLVLGKEITDILRDKRSFIMLFLPVLIFPMIYFFFGIQIKKANEEVEKDIPVAVECATASDKALFDAIFSGDYEELILETECEESMPDLNTGKVSAVFLVKNGTIDLVYNPNSMTSSKALQKLMEPVQLYSATLMATSLAEKGVDFSTVNQINFTYSTISDHMDGAGNTLLTTVAPMMLIMFIMSGGVSVAVDLFAGEKERGTLESLLTTQLNRTAMLLAKITAILFVSILSMLLSIAGYVISLASSPEVMELYGGSTEGGLGITPLILLKVIIVCFSLSLFAVSLMTFIGINAKTVKEAQTQMSMITLVPAMLGGITMFMESSGISMVTMFIPVFNTICTIKLIFSGTVETLHIIITSCSCVVYALLLGFVSARRLNSEKFIR